MFYVINDYLLNGASVVGRRCFILDVGGAKRENPDKKKHLAHPPSWLVSHVPRVGLVEPTPDTTVR